MAAIRHYRGKVGLGGRVVIPADARRQLNLKVGDDVTLELHAGELRLFATAESVERARAIVARYVSSERDLAGELLADRRLEESAHDE